jgi:protein-S-isoprenylcysteine O-methyltransferase Ste14
MPTCSAAAHFLFPAIPEDRGSEMLNLPPPIWALVYVLAAAAISWVFGWSKVPGFPFVSLGISLIAISWILPVWAIVLFRREGTEVEPTSATNRKLITRGPYQLTRNPMYVGLVVLTLGIAIWVGAWPMFGAPIALFATANWVHIPFEEAKMRRQFGAVYDNYVARVRRWI